MGFTHTVPHVIRPRAPGGSRKEKYPSADTPRSGNTVFEPGKEGSGYKGGGSGSGDVEEEQRKTESGSAKDSDQKDEDKQH
jgi:hypothetical protein